MNLRLGFLIPPGNPTTEPEVMALTPQGVTSHFTRMVAHGTTGSLDGQDERNRTQIAHLDENIALLAMIKPKVVVLAHTATSYTLGKSDEAALVARIEHQYKSIDGNSDMRFITAFGSVIEALQHLRVNRIAFGTPYNESSTLQCKANLEAYCVEIASFGRLDGVTNIYDETLERAYALAKRVDTPSAQAIFISGVGMPTVGVLESLEQALGKPVISSASAMMWQALRIAGYTAPVSGFGQLLRM
jgi:maleate isomerase